MGMAIADAIAHVRSLLDEPIENFWHDTELTTWLDAGQRGICSDVGIEVMTAISVSGVGDYPLSTDMKNLWMVEITGATHAKLISGRDYVFYAKTLRLLTPYTGTATLYGTKDPVTLASTFEVPDEAAWGAIYYAVGHAVRKDEAFNEDNTYMALYRDVKARRDKVFWDNVNMMIGPLHYYDRVRQGLPGGGGTTTTTK